MNFAQTELLIHVVNRDTNRILDVDRWVGSGLRPSAHLPALELGRGPPKEGRSYHQASCVGAPPKRWAGLAENSLGVYSTPQSLTSPHL